MALALGGFCAEAERAYDWLTATQHFDGSWCAYYLTEGIEDAKPATRSCADVKHSAATGNGGGRDFDRPRQFVDALTQRVLHRFLFRHEKLDDFPGAQSIEIGRFRIRLFGRSNDGRRRRRFLHNRYSKSSVGCKPGCSNLW